MVDVDKFSDAELRTKLMEFGFPALPITGTTRKVMVKKLKLLMENKNSKNVDNRRSLGKYSSEDDSDNEVKAVRNRRRVTMAAPPMQPPANPPTLKKTTRIVETTIEEDIPKAPLANVTSTRTSRIIKNVQNEYDTGSDSESEIIRSSQISSSAAEKSSGKQFQFTSSFNSAGSSLRESPKKSLDTSYSRAFSSTEKPVAFSSPVSLESSSDRLNQIRSRISVGTTGLDRSTYSSPTVENNWAPTEKEETPFLSNFTKRLSQLSASKYRNEVIKEQETNGATSYLRNPQYTSSRSTLRPREFHDYGRSNHNEGNFLKDNLVPFTVLLVAVLFFLFVGFIYLGMRSETSLETTGVKAPICDFNKKPNDVRGVNCVLEGDVEKAINLLKPLKAELKERAVTKYCDNSEIKDRMVEQDVVDFVKNKFKFQDESRILTDLRNLQVLALKNPSWGITITQAGLKDEINEKNIVKTLDKLGFDRVSHPISLTVLHPDIPWSCSMAKTFYTFIRTVLILSGIMGALYASNLGYKRYNLYQKRRRNEIIGLVEKILEVLQSSEGEDNYYVINHVRDMIIPVTERKAKDNIWKKAVEFINENESRVRTEIQVVQGEEYLVWRWVGSSNLSINASKTNKSWQGQAFETQTGAVNSLLCSPTPCLKIRGMVEEGDRNTTVIRQAVLGKCASKCRILHCAVDTKMKCVYMKCVDTQDAAVAYQNLHGWWYAGQLVTVKYVRLERYMQRFPDSPTTGPPYLNDKWTS
ncbi:LEM protein 2 [Coccinella septempunctata]|uniref:LEM protein 2 n=1 Tax=Coccinella septempunctata TaxID=41139 RepID=UPI001D06C8AD|nr:LEM protein 2 [Coccinella septempunctata]